MSRKSPAPANNDEARSSLPPDHIGVLLIAVVMMIGGWAGLFWLVTTRLPRIGGELWAFFALLTLAVTGTALPFVRYLNVRFTPIDRDVPSGGVLVRQSIWIALFVVTCSWLQILRTLSWPVAFFLVLVLVVIEIFLRSRELADE
ncbi:MAG: hypothetical protein HXY40_10750 [Chloroflexi bacterium]|nr:hypothetical protein [Chloroflexota bacterium]